MKKLLAMLLALCFIFSLSTVSYAEGNLVECDDITLTFCCSAAETTCWAQMANVFVIVSYLFVLWFSYLIVFHLFIMTF